MGIPLRVGAYNLQSILKCHPGEKGLRGRDYASLSLLVINYLFDYHSVCLRFTRVSYRMHALSIRVSRSFTRGLQPPCPSVLLHLYDKIIEIYNIAAQPYHCWHATSKQSHRAPYLRIYRL